jgi:hypothetical protein
MTLLCVQTWGKMGQQWRRWILPNDSVRRLTLSSGVRRSPVGQRLAALAIDRLFSAADARLMAFADLMRTISLAVKRHFGMWRAFHMLLEQ